MHKDGNCAFAALAAGLGAPHTAESVHADAVQLSYLVNRVATHLENLEISGNSKLVREKSGKNGKSPEQVRETEICELRLMPFELLAWTERE